MKEHVLRLVRRVRPAPPRRQVTLYGKPGCHLCEDARALLERLSRRYPMEIEEIDITTEPTLFRKYDIVIPVVVVDREVQLEAPISEQRLRRALAARAP